MAADLEFWLWVMFAWNVVLSCLVWWCLWASANNSGGVQGIMRFLTLGVIPALKAHGIAPPKGWQKHVMGEHGET